MPTDPQPKVAIVHDWINGMRGGEKVLECFCELFPQADIFTLFFKEGASSPTIEKHKIQASSLNSLPFVHRYYRGLLPLLPTAIEQFDLSGYDKILSISHCVAKGIVPAPNAVHVCYCLTPMRYSWDKASDYFRKGRKVVAPFLHYLKVWDVASSARVDHFVTLSDWVRLRILKYYRREASVVYPPVDTDFFQRVAGDRGDYYLTVSAFAPYKRLDIIIEACKRLGRKLLVVGEGQQAKSLKQRGDSNIHFLSQISPEKLRDLYSGARAFLFAAEEDFGIAPVEAMACGTPVIAYAKGGVTETVIANTTGLFFNEQSVEALSAALLEFEKKEKDFSPTDCRTQALHFSKQRFMDTLKRLLDELWG
ncbi:MAG: glycosyltransferase [Deltaproteobacteria bacterium]|nr:glycosyltransferase [Deltaproteobacteria bacterium]